MTPIRTIFFLLLFNLPAGIVSAQNCDYIKQLNQAHEYKIDSNFTWALQTYEEALELTDSPYSVHIWSLVHLHIYYADFDKADAKIRQLVTMGADFETLENKLWIYDAFMASKQWKKFKLDYPFLRKEFFGQHEIDVILTLEKIRSASSYSMRYHSSGVNDTIKQKLIDGTLNENMDRLRNLVHLYGWPSVAMVGTEYNGVAIRTLYKGTINGVRDEIDWKFFHPYLKEQMELGLLHPSTYALMCDKYELKTIGSQTYGSYYKGDAFSPIKNISSVDDRREKLCLISLRELVKNKDLNLPEGYMVEK